jgi:homopolymeric O-antigen transport system permease protein
MLLNNNLSQVAICGLALRLSSPEGLSVTYRNLYLLRELVRRDFSARFTGSVLGVGWAVLQPLTLVILYWFVFTHLIGGRMAGDRTYVYFLISGLLPWLGINEGMMRSATSMVENAAMVRRLSFRSELLVVVPNASAMILECFGLVVFLIIAVVRGMPAGMLWVLPFALLLQFALQLGMGFFLAAIYVFFRDLTQILGFALSILFYLSPILYPVVTRFEPFFFWNPMTALLGLFRSAILSAPLPDGPSIVFLLVVATVVFTTGLLFFRRAQPALVDLI